MISLAVSVAYLVVLGCLACFGAHRLHLLWVLWRSPPEPEPAAPPAVWPRVTVQLPLYNEASVAERLLLAVARLDYPRERLEVQVLDDSSDETADLVAALVRRLRSEGLAIEQLRRPQREGYKAGALAHGLARASGELIAIFDADFVPHPGFLRQVVPHFQDAGLGLVQARWGHLNRRANLLTRLQAVALDAHFRVEQAARSRSGRFFNFNGTAGVWRREAIEAAGGWSAETITEDLDLSFRAQLCGWRFRFLSQVEVPAELPEDLAAFRTQQQRWTRGSAQTLRKLFRPVWTTPDVPLEARLEATFQLLLNAAYPLMLLLALLTVPLALIGHPQGAALQLAQWLFFGFASGAVALFYLAAQRPRGLRALLDTLWLTPLLFACGLGLSLSNGWAWLAGLIAGPIPFERTPKRGAAALRRYGARRARWLVGGELLLALYLLAGSAGTLLEGRLAPLPFLALILLGYLGMGLGGLRREPQRAAQVHLTSTPTDPISTLPLQNPIVPPAPTPGIRGG